MSLSETAARGAAVTFVGQMLKFTIQIATLVVLTRILTPNDYGIVTMVTAIVGVALILGDFGLSMAAVQARVLTHGQKSNLFWLNTGIGLSSSVVVFFLASPIAAFYGRSELLALTQFLSIIFLLSGLNTQFKAELTRQFRFKLLSIVDVVAQATGFVVALIAALHDFGYWSLALQQIAIVFVTLILTSLLSRWRPTWPRFHEAMRALLGYGSNTMGVQVITYVSSNVDSVSIGRFWGAAPLGLYNRAFQMFALPMQQLATPMTRVAVPVLSRIEDDDQYLRYIIRAQLVLCYVLVGAFAISAAVAVPLFDILFGPVWSSSVPIFQILAIGGAFQALAYVYYWIFLSKALTKLQLKYSIIGRGAMSAFILIGVFWGPIGVATGYSVGLAAIWVIYSVFAIPKSGIRVGILVRSAARPIAAFGCAFGVVQLTQLIFQKSFGNFALLSVEILACLVFFAFLAAFINPFRRDAAMLLATIRLIRRRR
jgi:PST family polysaccharide transporter